MADTQAIENYFVLIHWPDGRIDHLLLGKTPIRFGRHPDHNDVVVPVDFTTISGSHMVIQYGDSGYEVVDLGSSNGTILNEQELIPNTPYTLSDQDEIVIGSDAKQQEIRLVMQLSGLIPTGLRKAVDVDTQSMPPPEPEPAMPEEVAYLSARWPSGQEVIYELDSPRHLLGRDPSADLIFPQSLPFVSNQHMVIERQGDHYTVTDLGSTNGTRVNNEKVTPNEPFTLNNGDLIRIGDDRFGASIGLTFTDPASSERAPVGSFTMAGGISSLFEVQRLTIGRDPSNDIVLESPTVSRHHAEIVQQNGGHVLTDLGTTNGLMVNGQRVEKAQLNEGDLVQIGPHMLVYDGETLSRYDSQGMRMDVVGVYKEVRDRETKKPIRLIDDISMTIMPKEFVALVGGSGAGKSTLMDALNGFRPASGHILLNANDFYGNYDSYRTQLGYVPQYDILHTSLDVMTALNYAARLRLPPDISAQERKERIETVLDTVELPRERWKTRISNLSGGQRKRVSIAVELLAEPKLFFLDEPTSGLDPGLEKKMMYTMRKMADEGRTILLITHATGNIVQADHVAFLSQGNLVYFGPPQDALDYFEVNEFADIYENIERFGDKWRKIFIEGKPQHYQRYVVDRSATRKMLPPGTGKTAKPGLGQTIGQMMRQFMVLAQRMVSIIFSEKLTLVVLMAIMPLIALFLVMVADSNVLIGDPDIINDLTAAVARLERTNGDSYLPVGDAQITLFAMSLAAVLFGLFASSNELVNERTIYLRERMVNLKLPSYIFSKLFVYMFFATISVLAFLIVLAFKVRYPLWGVLGPGFAEFFITMFIATMVSISMGLLISALARSQNMVSYMILIVLFVQIIFSGAIFNLKGNIFEPISYLTVTRWTLVGLGTTNDMYELGEKAIVCGNDFELDQDSLAFDTSSIEVDPDSIAIDTDNIEVDPDSIDFNPATGQVDTSNIEVDPDSIAIDTSSIEVDPNSIEVDTGALEFDEKENESRCSQKSIEPDDMSVVYGESFWSLAGVWVMLMAFGAIFTGLTFIFVKRLDRT